MFALNLWWYGAVPVSFFKNFFKRAVCVLIVLSTTDCIATLVMKMWLKGNKKVNEQYKIVREQGPLLLASHPCNLISTHSDSPSYHKGVVEWMTSTCKPVNGSRLILISLFIHTEILPTILQNILDQHNVGFKVLPLVL